MPIAVRRRPLRELAAILAVPALALAVSLALGGCTQPPPKPIPTGAPSAAEPVFASDDDALAAAEEAYALYQDAWNAIAMEGGADPERIGDHVSPEYLGEIQDGLQKFADRGIRTTGPVEIRSLRMQSYSEPVTDQAKVVAYVCLDFSGARLVNGEGADVTPPERLDLLPGQVTLVSSSFDSNHLVLGGDDVWTGENFCGP